MALTPVLGNPFGGAVKETDPAFTAWKDNLPNTDVTVKSVTQQGSDSHIVISEETHFGVKYPTLRPKAGDNTTTAIQMGGLYLKGVEYGTPILYFSSADEEEYGYFSLTAGQMTYEGNPLVLNAAISATNLSGTNTGDQNIAVKADKIVPPTAQIVVTGDGVHLGNPVAGNYVDNGDVFNVGGVNYPVYEKIGGGFVIYYNNSWFLSIAKGDSPPLWNINGTRDLWYPIAGAMTKVFGTSGSATLTVYPRPNAFLPTYDVNGNLAAVIHYEDVVTVAGGKANIIGSVQAGATTIAGSTNNLTWGTSCSAYGPNAGSGGQSNSSIGQNAFSEGQSNIVAGTAGHGEGASNSVYGYAAHAEGGMGACNGNYAHSGGLYTWVGYTARVCAISGSGPYTCTITGVDATAEFANGDSVLFRRTNTLTTANNIANVTYSGGNTTFTWTTPAVAGAGSTVVADVSKAIAGFAHGQYVRSAAPYAIVFGTGQDVSHYLTNSTAKSFMVGFDSQTPTLTVDGTSVKGTTIQATTAYKSTDGTAGATETIPDGKKGVYKNGLYVGNTAAPIPFRWSSTEQVWPFEVATSDGSTLYAKEFALGAMPNNATKTVALGLGADIITRIHSMYVYGRTTGDANYATLPVANFGTWDLAFQIVGADAWIQTQQNYTGWDRAFLRLIYKK